MARFTAPPGRNFWPNAVRCTVAPPARPNVPGPIACPRATLSIRPAPSGAAAIKTRPRFCKAVIRNACAWRMIPAAKVSPFPPSVPACTGFRWIWPPPLPYGRWPAKSNHGLFRCGYLCRLSAGFVRPASAAELKPSREASFGRPNRLSAGLRAVTTRGDTIVVWLN